jgi:hypothetical protein
MGRVASCPQCDHELLLPSEADSESWAKCPDCRAFFQVKQATSRELPSALLVDSREEQTIDLEPRDMTPQDALAPSDLETAVAESLGTDNEVTATLDDMETALADGAPSEIDLSVEPNDVDDDLDLDDLLDEPQPAPKAGAVGLSEDDIETAVAEEQPIADEIASTPADALGLNDVADAPKKGDDLEAAAQRIDEWFRSAKTVADTSLLDEQAEQDAMQEARADLATSGPARANVTIDMDAEDEEGLAAMADFDLSEPEERTGRTAAWDDTAQMDDLLGDESPADEFAHRYEQETQATDSEQPMDREEQPSINLFADGDAPQVDTSKGRRPRHERSFARSLVLIVVAGLFGSAAGYYALLWITGNDFLHVAHYLPKSILPATFGDQNIVRNAPTTTAPDAAAEVATDTETAADEEATEPQELPPAADATAEPMPDAVAGTDAGPTDAAGESSEVQASFTEPDPLADGAAAASEVGDRYSKPSETDASVANDSTASEVVTEKPATTDLSVDDLAPSEPAETQSATAGTADAAAPNLPTSSEPATTELTETDTASDEPATFDAPSADPLSDIADTTATEVVEIKIAGAPTFTSDNLRTSLEAAAKSQPQLIAGNFGDSKAVAQAKGRSYAMLADLAQKAMFADVAQQSAQPLAAEAKELFRATLANAHTRGEVAQILPRWIQSPNRKHGGVFFGGKVVGHTAAGSVVECSVELEGGQSLTVLAPADAVGHLDTSKPMAIVGWIVNSPKTQVSGYTGGATSPAIWAKELIPLE